MAGTNPQTTTASAQVFDCPACGGQLAIQAPGVTVSVYCTHCGSEIDAVNDKFRLLQKANEQLKLLPVIPLGQRGVLRGVTWEVIGFMQRSSSGYKWQEYLLFNPQSGFRWLVENQGHWTLFAVTKQAIDTSVAERVSLQNKVFKLFDDSTAKVDYVLGEFYWRVKRGDKARLQDYIAPPRMLSLEEPRGDKSKGEKIWSLGEYLSASEISAAFKIARSLPYAPSAGANQPNPFRGTGISMLLFAVLFTMLLSLISVVLASQHKPQLLLQQDYQGRGNGMISGQISPSFTVTQDHTVLGFDMRANVNNSWAELQIDVINEDTGKILQLEQGVEYWTGRDSDGAWSEGSSSSHRKLTRIPAGHYHLDVDYNWSAPTDASLHVTQGEHSSINFWIACILLFLPPIALLLLAHFFEVRRWADSPYNPYQTEE